MELKMIGETGAVTVQINSERVNRESSVQPDKLQQNEESEVEQQPQEFSDVTSFSAEALALSRQVTAASGSVEQQGAEPSGQNQQEAQSAPFRSVDVLA